MRLKDTIQEPVGLMNLFHGARARNDDGAGAKDAHCDAFTLTNTGARSLTLTEGRTITDARALVDGVIEVLGVDALVYRLFKHTKEVVLFDKEPVEIVLLNVVVERIIRVDELDADLCHGGSSNRCKGARGKALDEFEKPFNGLDRKFLGWHTRHLNGAASKEFHVDLFPSTAHATTQNEGVLIKEGLVGRLTICKEVLVARSKDGRVVLGLENALGRIANGDKVILELRIEAVEIDGKTPVGCHRHGGDT